MLGGNAMRKKQYFSRKLKTIEVKKKSLVQLLKAMGRTGFQGKSLVDTFKILKKMISKKENTIFFGYAGSLSTTGQWKIIKWLLENRYIDVLVSTGANISEDILEGLGYSYFQGTQLADDVDLLKSRIYRFYDIYAKEPQYRKMERFIYGFMSTLDPKKIYSSAEFLNLFGKYQNERGVDSITAAAYRAKVPIFSPGLADSAYGIAAFLLHKEKKCQIILDQFKDFVQLGEIGCKSKTTSVIYIGGGVPKDTIQLVSILVYLGQGGKKVYPHKYAVQITTDSPQWGGLSGCTFEEAISWGKIDQSGNRAICYCDATIALPILSHGLLERIKRKRKGVDFSWLFSGIKSY